MGHDKAGLLLHCLQVDARTRFSTQYLFMAHAGVTNPKAYNHAFLQIEHNETFACIYDIEGIRVNTKFCLNTVSSLEYEI
jgi:hypothetical protein